MVNIDFIRLHSKQQENMSEDNSLAMYIIINTALGMSVGKTVAQGCHAVEYLCSRYQEIKSSPEGYLFKKWMSEGNHRKIVLAADSKEWLKVKEEFRSNPNCAIVHDAGFTEIPSGSETAYAIWPMYKKDAPKILQRLQLLK